MSSKIGIWIGVVGDSRFQLSVNGKTSDDRNFISNARIVPDSGAERLLQDHQLNPGPKAIETKTDNGYAIRVAVKFIGDSSEHAIVTAKLLKPDGSAHPDDKGDAEYSCELSGKAGDPTRRCTLILLPLVL